MQKYLYYPLYLVSLAQILSIINNYLNIIRYVCCKFKFDFFMLLNSIIFSNNCIKLRACQKLKLHIQAREMQQFYNNK